MGLTATAMGRRRQPSFRGPRISWRTLPPGTFTPDGRLFFWISEGIGGTAMPAFKDRLSETERWDVVNFLKTFTPAER